MLGMMMVKLVGGTIHVPVWPADKAIYCDIEYRTVDGFNQRITDHLTLCHPDQRMAHKVAISAQKVRLIAECVSPEKTLIVGVNRHGTVDRYCSPITGQEARFNLH